MCNPSKRTPHLHNKVYQHSLSTKAHIQAMNNTTSAHLTFSDISLLYPLNSSTGNSLDLNLSHNTVTSAQAQQIPSYNTALFGSMPTQSYSQPLYPHLTTDPQQTLMTLHQQYQHQCLQQYLQQQQLQLAQQQQQITQQQQNIQLALQQQQTIPVLTTPMSSHLSTFPEPLGLLNREEQWPSWSTETSQLSVDQGLLGHWNQEEQHITNLLFTPDPSHAPHITTIPFFTQIDSSQGGGFTQQGSSNNLEVALATTHGQIKKEESEEKPQIGSESPRTKSKRNQKISDQCRLDILAHHEASGDESLAKLGKRFGVSKTSVHRIINNTRTQKPRRGSSASTF
ncbi:MAG: hypothetical protein J3Q66DRAFT_353259 [Benniella sp.]|nr:MAG: hypothetical protein J3Q66DRAFT_353259 [Benniella sp.]